MVRESDDERIDRHRRRILRGLAATGVGLAGVGQASAGHRPGDSGGAAPGLVEHAPFFGFAHDAVGGAGLDPSGDSLVVDGPDGGGVRAAVGEAESFLTETAFDLGSEVGAYREFVGRGVVDGDPGRVVGSARLVHTGGEVPLELRPDFGPVGADGYDLEVYRRGELVHEGVGLTGYVPQRPVDVDDLFDVEYEWVWTGAGWMLVIRFVIDVELWPPDDDDGSGAVHAGVDPVVGDELRLSPTDPSVALGPVTHVDVLGDGQPAFALDGEAVGFQGHDVRQVGDAALHPVDGGKTLAVTGLGETGGDGVALGVDTGEGFRLSMEPTELPADGSRLAGRPRGVLDGAEQRLGEAGLTREDDVLVIDGDFTPIETDGVEVTLFQADEVLDELAVEAGELGYVEGDALLENGLTWPWPPECPPFCPPWPPWPPWPPCVEFGFEMEGGPVPLPIDVDGETFEADRIRLRALDPEVELGPEALAATEVTGANLEQLVFVDEPPTFP